MRHQTEMNGSHAVDSPSHALARSAGDLWHHVMLLGELQARLFVVEVEAALRGARMPAALLAVGCVLGMAAVPMLLVCVALVLVEVARLSPAAAFGLVAGVSLLCAVALVAIGWQRLRHESIGAPRSREEWRQNWSWMKETLRRERVARNGKHHA
jgi:uncharacterized membrane protein YqjE